MKSFNVTRVANPCLPLPLAGDSQRLAAVFWQSGRMASSTIRAGERETGMAGFIIKGGIFAMPVMAKTIIPCRGVLA